MSKCKRCEESKQAENDAKNWLSVSEAENSGLAQAYRDILDDNRALWDDYIDDRRTAVKLYRKIAKLKKRLAKLGE